MEIKRDLVDKDFDRYVLAVDGVHRQETLLQSAVLEPLDATKTTRKAQWEARVHYNALTADPFRSDAERTVAYYVDAEYQIVQVVAHASNVIETQPIYQMEKQTARRENVTLRAVGKGLLACNDGTGKLRFLKSEDADKADGSWSAAYECEPLGSSPSLLLEGVYDEDTSAFRVALAEPIQGTEKEAAFRLWVAEVSCATGSDSMDVDSGAVGVTHNAFEVGVVASMPEFLTFQGAELLVLIEGTCDLMIEPTAEAQVSAVVASNASQPHTPKRHHDESELEMDIDEVLSKLPRAGIGYHGDISDVKHLHDLAVDLTTPLEQRFHKSSTPYSSLEEPLHSASTENAAAAREARFEMPTPDTILGGFEECDDIDPNAKAALFLVDTKNKLVQDKMDIKCSNFRFLCSSVGNSPSAALLFQNDVHGLVFSIQVQASRFVLSHTSTLPAFGFVQASKQDKKYMTFHTDADFACIAEFERRIFVYHGASTDAEHQAHTRKQNVIEVGDHQLLGMRVVGKSVLLLSPHHIYHIRISA
ncbi:hypothetical protein Poli38472_003181 [Pythium oligandrum]|uniref:NudC domain-containing protein 1 n=1 Tax=Pythium oligandrum TaxID=41045 RepID=A0A8K1FCJ2_PYTOL|nr:hypothetical protein Poli38472_003181 [Pythium oligandrum]|eukprot:TMW57256.1 hypothetical protein Poli38472_003181 [Pythium oligandrum]